MTSDELIDEYNKTAETIARLRAQMNQPSVDHEQWTAEMEQIYVRREKLRTNFMFYSQGWEHIDRMKAIQVFF
jgi:hypothetical protein